MYIRAVLFCFGWLILSVNLAVGIPKPEHPRPDWRRDSWKSLNGTWQFAFEDAQSGEELGWPMWPHRDVQTRDIVVPFPWESVLSGIHQPDKRGTGWYFRSFEIPPDWAGRRIWLVFGAVDFETTVWVNGTRVGHHVGGYDPFGFDITDLCRWDGPNHLVVRAVDLLDRSQSSGKQTGWYTPTSGIWQTVYLEARGKTYTEDAVIRTDASTGTVFWTVKIAGQSDQPLLLEVAPDTDPDGLGWTHSFGEAQSFPVRGEEVEFRIDVDSPRLWAPGSPNLYFCRLTLKSEDEVLDTVHTYFGIRSVVRRSLGSNLYEYIYLNGRPIYLMGALDQSFNPEGIYTFPDDRATRFDVEKALDFGFNFLRIHIKIEEPRFYYWADRLGLMIMQDMPNFNRYDDKSKELFESMLEAVIRRDKNHPCIFAWVLFNETWGLEKHNTKEGQAWVEELVRHTKRLDPTRLVEDNSACRYDHVLTDINSWHFYIYDYKKASEHIRHVVEQTYPGSKFNYIGDRSQGAEPLMNSEYGGVSAGMGDRDISWCFHYLTTELRKHEKICGYIYTELQDIEWEHNGMMDYDRSPKVFGYEEFVPVPEDQSPFSYRDLNSPDFLGIDIPPLAAYKPGDTLRVGTWISRFSGEEDEKVLVSWRLRGVGTSGQTWRSAGVRTRASAPLWAVSPLATLEIGPLPQEPMVYVLCVAAENRRGEPIARNFATFHTLTGPAPRLEIEGRHCVLRWKPGDAFAETWNNRLRRFDDGGKVFAEGSGRVEYRVKVPAAVLEAGPEQVELLVELGACAGTAKIDWPERIRKTDYPQTEPDKKFPTDVTISMNGVSIETVLIPDDPADVRGILSNLGGKQRHPSSYGFLQRIVLSREQVSKVFDRLEENQFLRIAFKVKENAAHKGGISIYGEREGRYPVDPTLIITTKQEIKETD